jgi:hypothetical protein
MTNSNSNEVANLDRAFYELVHLMRHYSVIPDPILGVKLTTDTPNLKLLQTYSKDLTLALIWGLQSMGRLVSNAVRNKETGFSVGDVANVAELFSTIADCIEATTEIAFDTRDELHRRKAL